MAHMDPIGGKKFQLGNDTVWGDKAPDFDLGTANNSVLLIITVDKFGAVKMWNNKATPEDAKLKDISDGKPYPTGGIYDIHSLDLGIYEDPSAKGTIKLGVWNPGPPKKCYT